MGAVVEQRVVITGLGMMTAMGWESEGLLAAIQNGQKVISHAAGDVLPGIQVAPISGFDPEQWISEPKSIRMMSREAQLAVAAATLAVRDSGVAVGTTYAAQEIGLFGATGLAGIPLEEVGRLVRASASPEGALDLQKFGADALRQVRPVLSFKILANMPLCFVSIFLNVQGPNAIFSPWEQHGAQAIAAGADAVRRGRCRAALVGGTDVKTHELGLLALKQQGVFSGGRGALTVGEGAAFVLLEQEQAARSRNARIYARLVRYGMGGLPYDSVDGVVVSTGSTCRTSWQGNPSGQVLSPKDSVGDLFAAASAIQVGMGSLWCSQGRLRVRACCAGHGGSGKGWEFHLEAA